MAGISYADYVMALRSMGQDVRHEDAGVVSALMSEEDWNRMSPADQARQITSGGSTYAGGYWNQDSDFVRGMGERFQSQFGKPPADWFGQDAGQWNPNDRDYRNNYQGYSISATPPDLSRGFDPSRVLHDPETGLYMYERENSMRPDAIAAQQHQNSQGQRDLGLAGLAMVLGGPLLAGQGFGGYGLGGAGAVGGEAAAGIGAEAAGAGSLGISPEALAALTEAGGAGAGASGSAGAGGAFAGAEAAGSVTGGPLASILNGDLATLWEQIQANPMGAIRAGAGIASLLGGGGGGGSGGGGGGGSGPAGPPMNFGPLTPRTFTQNPETLRQLEEYRTMVYGGKPLQPDPLQRLLRS